MSNIKALDYLLSEKFCTQSFVSTFQKGAYFRNYTSIGKERKTCQVIYHKQVIYGISNP